MTITEFLLARIAEDEESVRALLAEGWTHDGAPSPTPETPMARVGRWAMTPARVLAECEAKRQLIALAYRISADDARSGALIVEALASVYADHDDYREEWQLRT